MKNLTLTILLIVTIALAATCLLQRQKLAAQQTEIASLRAEAERNVQTLADLQASRKRLEEERDGLLQTQAGALAGQLQATQRSKKGFPGVATRDLETGEKQDKNPFGNFLAKMMEDPDTKKMIREQQRVMLNQLYAPLIKKLELTPEEASQFKDLLADSMMKGTENATSLMGGSTNRTEVLEKLAADQKESDEQIRGFLGESRYLQYKDYQQTVGERTQLSQFQQQTAGTSSALSEHQTEALLVFMKEEKQSAAATARLPLPGESPDAATMQAMFSAEGMDKLLQTQESVNQRVYERSKEILSPEQLDAFGKFQTNQLKIMGMGLTMAQKLIGAEKTESATPKNP